MKNIKLFCNFSIPGVHSWSECPHEDVSYLRSQHRHLFGFSVVFEVTGDNREIEFIRFSNHLQKWIKQQLWNVEIDCLDFENMSCEQIASYIFDGFINVEYPNIGRVDITVNEDGENGATVSFSKNRGEF